jgi:hypothetical protein
MILWGIERTLDEHLWLGQDGHLGSLLVQIAGVLLVIGGGVILIRTRRRWTQWLAGRPEGPGTPQENVPEDSALEGSTIPNG